MSEYPITAKNKVKRAPKRAHYDQETIHKILDDAFLCHIGFQVGDQPYVIPTCYGRDGETLYIHGAASSRMMLNLKEGIPICLTVTHLDGLVLARSAFHHSMNYRSAVIFGKATEVAKEEKEFALKIISEQILKGRWEESRQPSAKELKATSLLKLDIEHASAKVRTGPPGDEKEDYSLPIWAGVIPIQQTWSQPEADPLLKEGILIPKSVKTI